MLRILVAFGKAILTLFIVVLFFAAFFATVAFLVWLPTVVAGSIFILAILGLLTAFFLLNEENGEY